MQLDWIAIIIIDLSVTVGIGIEIAPNWLEPVILEDLIVIVIIDIIALIID